LRCTRLGSFFERPLGRPGLPWRAVAVACGAQAESSEDVPAPLRVHGGLSAVAIQAATFGPVQRPLSGGGWSSTPAKAVYGAPVRNPGLPGQR
jgi:hypothetical protein